MIQALLEIFTTTEKAEAMLASPMIEFIFTTLFILFILTILVHFILFFKIRHIRNYVNNTARLDMEPLRTFEKEFEKRQAGESIQVETFVQEKISSWRMANIPVVNLIKLVQMTVSVFILLGVLGTFIGLTISLGSIETTGDQLVENVSGVLSGIDVAFYTSIVGMGFSLIMTVLVRMFNTEYLLTDLMLKLESHLEGEEQHGMNRMIDVSEHIHQAIVHLQETNEQSLQGIVESFDGFKDYTAGLEQAATDLATFNDGLSENLTEFHTLFEQMKEVTDGFETGTTALNRNFNQLFMYMEQTEQRSERMMNTFEKTYDNIHQVQEAQLQSFATFDTSMKDLQQFTTSSLEAQQGVQQTLQQTKEQMNQLVEQMKEHHVALRDLFGDQLHADLANITSYIKELAREFNQIGTSIVTLPQALEVINDTQAQHKDLLTDRFRELQAFNESFHTHIQQHAQESKTLDQHIQSTSSSFEQMTNRNQQLIQQMIQAIEQAQQTFSQRDHQLESNVTMMKDTLSNYVQSLEGTLGQKLDTMNRNIEQNMQHTQDKLHREMTDIRRLSDETNQNQARAMQQLLQDLTREMQTMSRHIESMSQARVNNQRTGLPPHES